MFLQLCACLFFHLIQVTQAIQVRNMTPTEEMRGYYRRDHSLVKPYQGLSGMRFTLVFL